MTTLIYKGSGMYEDNNINMLILVLYANCCVESHITTHKKE
jgi:hypothetical protein